MVQLFGIDETGLQIYECRISKLKDAKDIAKKILEGMDHVVSVVAVENVPNVTRHEDSFHISYQSKFLFIETRT